MATMPAGLSVRPFRPADAEDIVPFERLSFGSYAFDAERLIHWAGLPRAVSWCAAAGDRVVGYAIIVCRVDDAHVISLAVDPAYRARGIGATLFHAASNQVTSEGLRTIRAEVRVEDSIAQRFWRSLGFVGASVVEGFYPDGASASVLEYVLVQPEAVTERAPAPIDTASRDTHR